MRQVSEIEGWVIDAFGALHKSRAYLELSATPPEGGWTKAKDGVDAARRELDAALKQNPDTGAQRLATQVSEEMNRLDATLKTPPAARAALCELINDLNGLAHVVRETMQSLQFVDVRREGG